MTKNKWDSDLYHPDKPGVYQVKMVSAIGKCETIAYWDESGWRKIDPGCWNVVQWRKPKRRPEP